MAKTRALASLAKSSDRGGEAGPSSISSAEDAETESEVEIVAVKEAKKKKKPAAKAKAKAVSQKQKKAVLEFSIEEETGHWIPLYEDETMAPYVARVEYAKSGRATCRMCCEKIEKASAKVGLPMKWQGGKNAMAAPYGYGTSWAHARCVRVRAPPEGPKAVEKMVYGIDALSPKDRKSVVDEITRTDTPESLKELRPEDLEAIVPARVLEECEPPEALTQNLLPFQKEGLGWMLDQEDSEVKGGILADEMGMGKTIQTIALLLASKERDLATEEQQQKRRRLSLTKLKSKLKSSKSDGEAGTCPATLIIVPTSALMQWAEEIKNFTKEGSLTAFIYYGDRSEVTREDFYSHDVVLTTYPVVEIEYRKVVDTLKVKCEYCGKMLLPRTLYVHQRYFCGPDAVKTERLLKREKKQKETNEKAMQTLRIKSKYEEITPTITNVYKELMEEANRAPISMFKKGGASTSKAAQAQEDVKKEEEGPDCIDLTQDSPPDSPGKGGKKKAKTKKKGESPLKAWEANFQDIEAQEQLKDQSERLVENSLLHGVHWKRLILDEAHKIKARTTSVAKSIYSLRSDKKWCLTGTPLQNRVGELYSLLRFLELDPYAYYFCGKKGCDCKSLHWRFGPKQKACECCGHPGFHHFSYFNRTILNPITRFGYLGEGKRAVIELKKVLDNTQLRRTKKGRAEDVRLPPLNIEVREMVLDAKEKDFYESLYKETQVKFDAYVNKGTLLHNYAHIFELLSRLRQAVNHPFLVIHGNEEEKKKLQDDAADSSAPGDKTCALCGICQEEVSHQEVVSSEKCGHEFHRTCMMQYVMALPPGGKLKCPVCFQVMTIDLSETEEHQEKVVEVAKPAKTKGKRASILSKIDTKSFVTSSKIESLVRSIQEMQKAGSEHKGIIFSQYTRMLDICEWRIQKLGVRTVKMIGSQPIVQRRAMLEAFKHDDSVKLLLLSLKAGGEGLNLQVASHVFVLEPWWNPAVEMQAIQRAHRIGQTRPVKAVRFFTKGTIEERMMQLQDKKKLVFEGTIDNNLESLTRLNTEDIRFLFS
ncbi:ATP-dependent helicase [Chloropicon primus]|uniref:ATP-dependent helicase n=3 Tax=Chloropicon primus TaxID=1764295 RepID=A0A5B8MVB5_9CHLO|nr:ATP-dependent helicase [Chloropicon primus]UPR02562.1 ATP-dependent helicase [Chloropicon primus]|eukprot:QDZ23350.1 ATP-dependent helicase [Chloropicon primus]